VDAWASVQAIPTGWDAGSASCLKLPVRHGCLRLQVASLYPRTTCSRSPSPHSRVPGGNGLSTLEQLSRPPWNSLVDCARARAQPVRARGPIGRVRGNWHPRPRYSGGRAKHRALFDKGASRKATHTTDAIAPMAHGPRCARPARAGWWVENG